MVTLLYIAMGNAVGAALLVAIALVGARLSRSAAVAHGHWLLVFVKLLTPPFLPVPLAWEAAASSESLPPFEVPALAPAPARKLDATLVAERLRALEEMPPPAPDPSLTIGLAEVLVGLWMLGAVLWFGRTGACLLRFRRLLRHALAPPEDLQA